MCARGICARGTSRIIPRARGCPGRGAEGAPVAAASPRRSVAVVGRCDQRCETARRALRVPRVCVDRRHVGRSGGARAEQPREWRSAEAQVGVY